MRFLSFCCIGLFLLWSASAQSQYVEFDWAKTFEGNVYEVSGNVVMDDSGNIYVSGFFQDTLDVDPGPGVHNLISIGSYTNIFIQKSDSNGNFIWANVIGSTMSNGVSSIHLDAFDHLYVTGYFEDTVDFDPGPDTFNLVAIGVRDIYIQKLDLDGNLIWAKSMGGTHGGNTASLTTDQSGNIYCTGSFERTVDFDPDTNSVFNLTATGDYDVFILKLDSNGNFNWAKSIGDSDLQSASYIALDSIGNVYTSGGFRGTVDFDPGPGIFTMISQGSFHLDGFLLKLDNNGDFIWAKSLVGTGTDVISKVLIGDSGNIYLGGIFRDTTDFDMGASVHRLVSEGSSDVFVEKLDSNGDFLWVKSMGGSQPDFLTGMQFDHLGNICIVGNFQWIVDFDPGPDRYEITTNGGVDFFIQKFAANGDFLWVKTLGGPSSDDVSDLVINSSGSIYLTGRHAISADLDPGPGVYSLNPNGLTDIFIEKLIPCSPVYATDTQIACRTFTWLNGITYTADNDTVTYLLPGAAANGCDSIVTLNLTILYNSSFTDTAVACHSFTWVNGGTYYASTNGVQAIFWGGAANGCDSIVSLNLTILPYATSTEVITACDSLVWRDGITYTSSNNTATDTIFGGAANGCDSIITLDLTILNRQMYTDVVEACDSITWVDGITYYADNDTAEYVIAGGASNGCDSIVFLDLTVHYSDTGTDSIVACDAYTWINGITYTSSTTTAKDTLSNALGCDSVVTLNLTINRADRSVSSTDTSILANTASAVYQWLDCNNNFAVIPGATDQLFLPTKNGVYAVEVTENGCADTSACINMSKLAIGINERISADQILIYPNPVNDRLTISTHSIRILEIQIMDITGKVLETQRQRTQTVDVSNLSNGIYFIQFSTDKGMLTRKFVKQ